MDAMDSLSSMNTDNYQMSIIQDSIQDDMAKNKEALRRRLETRRSLQHLVEQGIMPPPSVPPHFFEQSKQLQMAKTQDVLKRKIVKRPDRKVLIDHHILPDSNAAPLLQVQQQRLKKAKLADDLNDKLSKRPGPLELVEHNILETTPSVKEAIKGGLIQYKKTSSTTHPSNRLCSRIIDEDIASSPESLSVLAESDSSSTSVFNTETSCINNSGSTSSADSKSKSKPAKSRVWKRNKHKNNKSKHGLIFHEYKGPSNKSEVSKSSEDKNGILDSYKILLQQQQLFLQLVQTQHLVLPTPDGFAVVVGQNPSLSVLPVMPSRATITNLNSLSHYSVPNVLNPVTYSNGLESSEILNLQNLKVLDLKSECRRRKLGISGTKQQLIDRIKEQLDAETINPTVEDEYNTNCFTPLVEMNTDGLETDTFKAKKTQTSSLSSVNLLLSNSVLCPEELLQQQDKKIDELDKQLEEHKNQLKDGKLYSHDFGEVKPKCDPILSVQLQKRILEQHRSRLQAILADSGTEKKRSAIINETIYTDKRVPAELASMDTRSAKKSDESLLRVGKSATGSQQNTFEEMATFQNTQSLTLPSVSFENYPSFENVINGNQGDMTVQSLSHIQNDSSTNCSLVSDSNNKIQELMNCGSMTRNDTIDDFICMLSSHQNLGKDMQQEIGPNHPETNSSNALPSFDSLLPISAQSIPSFNMLTSNQELSNNEDRCLESDMSMDWTNCEASGAFADSFEQPQIKTTDLLSEKQLSDISTVLELCNNEMSKDCFENLFEDFRIPQSLSWIDSNYLELSNPPSSLA